MVVLKNKINALLLSEQKFLKNIKYGKKGYYIHKKMRHDYKLTVVLPVYNAENTLNKTLESIVDQTIGIENIQLLVVDDLSTDKSREIILDFSSRHTNIVPVFLEHNSGSPSKPRNLGIDLARGKYITFVDSDDWLDSNGLKILYDILEKTKDNYVVGKTVKLDDKGKHIVGEYNSWTNREKINPLTIKHIFHHLGPTARMMNTEFLKQNKIKFPDMKFAEDKQFFIDVITKCDTISTSKEIIYYANRYSDNKSFTTTTSIFEKTDTNISLINYVKEKKLPINIEKMILNRLYEFDCITRLFDRGHFLKSKEKNKYYEKFAQVIATTQDLKYDFTDNFFEPWHKTLVQLFNANDYSGLLELIKWNKKESIKEYTLKENSPYYKLPLNDPKFVKMNMLAIHHASIKELEYLILQFKVYGDYRADIQSLVLRERNNDLNQIELEIKIKEDLFEAKLPYNLISQLNSGSYAVYLKYHDYLKLPIRMDSRKVINYNKKKIDFYTTISDNFGLNLK
ncbi:glycosyltransferase [Virgibacillus halodenitrificans]|nr:glycosyltransferase [Virgibacillus halodenitrificans]